jgi:hypothetical protein
MNAALEKIKQLTKEDGGDPENPRDLYNTLVEFQREVRSERIREHRWWDVWLHIIRVDDMYIGYERATANRDESVFDLGWEFRPESIRQMIPYKETVIRYKPVSDVGEEE